VPEIPLIDQMPFPERDPAPDNGPSVPVTRPTFFIHIGAAKSGSSAIQEALGQNAANLRRLGVIVPDSRLGVGGPITGNHVSFFQSVAPVTDEAVAAVSTLLIALRQEADRAHAGKIVVSAENLINPPSGFTRLFAHASESFDVRVVAYIRRQDDHMLACWRQWGFKDDPDQDAWLQRVKTRWGDWDRMLGVWEQGLPSARVTVRVFDRTRLVGGDVVTDFLDVLGVPTDGLTISNEPVNRGLNDVATRIAVRNPHLFVGRHDHRFIQFLQRFGGNLATVPINAGLAISADERRALVALHADGNESVRQRYFPELPEGGLFSSTFVEAEPALESNELLEREMDLLWTVLFRLVGQTID
jgi:hypothetical protein